ncbi:MAG: hypothetical protein P0S95_03640 [Rhabdochlamydiaceae bacterium]|nr:hypothetical protein [Candidatus Amphrikana amoebophyrae]
MSREKIGFVIFYTYLLERKLQISKRIKSILLGSSVSFVAKTIGFITQLITTAFVASYYSSESFGIWAIFISFVILSPCFDLGLGGPVLRNHLVKLTIDKKNDGAKDYYFATTQFLFILYGSIGIIFLNVLPYLNWASFFHVESQVLSQELPTMITYVALMLLIRIPFAMNADAFYAYHESHIRGILDGIEFCILSLVAFCCVKFNLGFTSLIYLYFGAYAATSLVSFVYFLVRRHWKIKIILNMWSLLKPQLNLSVNFWVQNVAGLFLLSQLPTYIAHFQSAAQLGRANLLFRLFTPFIGVHFTLMNPIWTHYTQAMLKGEFKWIKRMLWVTSLITFVGFTCMIIVICFLHSPIIELWTTRIIHDYSLATAIGFWSLLCAMISCFSVFLSAISQIKSLMWIYISGAILTYGLSKIGSDLFGVVGIIYSHVCTLLLVLLLLMASTYSICKKSEISNTGFSF